MSEVPRLDVFKATPSLVEKSLIYMHPDLFPWDSDQLNHSGNPSRHVSLESMAPFSNRDQYVGPFRGRLQPLMFCVISHET
jgi:hypothetical protein